MPPADLASFPVGGSVTLEELESAPYERLAELRCAEPVSWLPALGGWFVTRRDLAIEAMRNTEVFTVDDPRFTTAAVLGESMLSLDGPEHERHRSPFASSFRPGVLREDFDAFLAAEASSLVSAFKSADAAELRSQLAGPLAVNTITRFLGLEDVSATDVLSWYQSIGKAITDMTTHGSVDDDGRSAVIELRARVAATIEAAPAGALLVEIARSGALDADELGSAAAVLMFGAIETAEGMTTNAIWHLLSTAGAWQAVREDRRLLAGAIEESLRLEPAASWVDRYTTRAVALGGVEIPAGDLVTISLLGANRDPEVFTEPDDFELGRANARQHVTFVQGPHGCIGLHLARMETEAAVNALLDQVPKLELNLNASEAPRGLIFRKAPAVVVGW